MNQSVNPRPHTLRFKLQILDDLHYKYTTNFEQYIPNLHY